MQLTLSHDAVHQQTTGREGNGGDGMLRETHTHTHIHTYTHSGTFSAHSADVGQRMGLYRNFSALASSCLLDKCIGSTL